MVSKVHVANRRLGPPAAEPGRGPRRVTAEGGGRGKGRERGGLGSPREFPFPLEQRKVCLRGICHSRAGQGSGARGAGDPEKVCAAGTLGADEGEPSLPRARRAVPGAGGGQHGVWAQDWGGGAEVGAQPPPLPSPSGPSLEHKAERARSAGPAPRRVILRGAAGEGGGTQTFSCPGTDT